MSVSTLFYLAEFPVLNPETEGLIQKEGFFLTPQILVSNAIHLGSHLSYELILNAWQSIC